MATIPCETCGAQTRMTGTKRCDGCWEVEHRLADYVRLGGVKAVATILGSTDIGERLEELAQRLRRTTHSGDELLAMESVADALEALSSNPAHGVPSRKGVREERQRWRDAIKRYRDEGDADDPERHEEICAALEMIEGDAVAHDPVPELGHE